MHPNTLYSCFGGHEEIFSNAFIMTLPKFWYAVFPSGESGGNKSHCKFVHESNVVISLEVLVVITLQELYCLTNMLNISKKYLSGMIKEG